jgi:hypothetical protein
LCAAPPVSCAPSPSQQGQQKGKSNRFAIFFDFFDLSLDFIDFSFDFCKGQSKPAEPHQTGSPFTGAASSSYTFTAPLDSSAASSSSCGIGFDFGIRLVQRRESVLIWRDLAHSLRLGSSIYQVKSVD